CTCQSCFFFFSSRRRHTRWPRDWSSDVCSSDLNGRGGDGGEVRIALAPEIDHPHAKLIRTSPPSPPRPLISLPLLLMLAAVALEIGRASCRERVWVAGGAESVTKKKGEVHYRGA